MKSMAISMRKILILMALLPLAAMSSNDKYYEVPKGSDLILEFESEGMPHLEFSGNQIIRAKYRISCERNCPDVILFPNDDSANIMPYLIRNGKPEKVDSIWIKNDDEIALKIVGKENIDKLNEDLVFVGEVEVVISKFVATYECDSASYGVTVSSLGKIFEEPKVASYVEDDDC
jgi:hypothetical protein